MRFFRNWVLHNWHLKLFALLAAFLLWSTYTSEPASEVAYLVPIEYRNIPPRLEISGDVPTQLRVRLRGRPTLLRRLTPADLAITLDLAGRQAGDVTIALTPEMIEAPYGATVVRISLSEIHLQLTPRK
jgi:YbbR domain-containing protein